MIDCDKFKLQYIKVRNKILGRDLETETGREGAEGTDRVVICKERGSASVTAATRQNRDKQEGSGVWLLGWLDGMAGFWLLVWLWLVNALMVIQTGGGMDEGEKWGEKASKNGK
jgi:hypothetical protein